MPQRAKTHAADVTKGRNPALDWHQAVMTWRVWRLLRCYAAGARYYGIAMLQTARSGTRPSTTTAYQALAVRCVLNRFAIAEKNWANENEWPFGRR